MFDFKKFSDDIKREFGLQDKDLCEIMQLSPTTYNRWRKGQIYCKVMPFVTLCDKLNISFDIVLPYMK